MLSRPRTQPTQTLTNKSTLSDGGAGSGLLHRAVFSSTVSMRRMPDRAPLGPALNGRVSANAVGRHSFFLRARVVVASDTSLRARRKDDAGAPEGCAGRPGLGIRVRNPGLRERARALSGFWVVGAASWSANCDHIGARRAVPAIQQRNPSHIQQSDAVTPGPQ